jgi:hypothetical protein
MTKINSASTVSKMVARGITRQALVTLQYSGANLHSWLGGFDSIEESICNSVDVIRNHPLCPVDVPVHGLLICPTTGHLELVVDGYKELPVLTGGVPAGHSAWLESIPPMSPQLRPAGLELQELHKHEASIALAARRARSATHHGSESGGEGEEDFALPMAAAAAAPAAPPPPPPPPPARASPEPAQTSTQGRRAELRRAGIAGAFQTMGIN